MKKNTQKDVKKEYVKRRHGRYFIKAFTAYLAMFLVFTVAICAIVYAVLPSVYEDMKLHEMEKVGLELRSKVQGMTMEEIKRELDEFSIRYEYGIVLLSEDDTILYSPPAIQSRDGRGKPPKDNLIQSYKGRLFLNEEGHIEVNDRYWYCTIKMETEEGSCKLLLTSMRKPDSDMYQILLRIAPALLGAGLLFAVVVSYFFARWMTKPVLMVARQAKQMLDMDPTAAEYKVHSSDEVEILQEDLIQLYENLQITVQELQITNQQLQEQIQVVQGMEKQKAEFFAAASHELKTPIAAASVMLEGMIDQTGSYQDRERYLRECRKQMSRLSKLVQDILDITKLESITVQQEELDLKACLDKLVDEYDVLAERQMVHITRNYSGNLQVRSDRILLKRAISNLLSNAVKYTPMEGNIVVSTHKEDTHTIIRITNDSEPIEEKVLSNYRNAFARPESARSGSGLGLYIVHQICGVLGCEFRIANTENGVEAEIRIA